MLKKEKRILTCEEVIDDMYEPVDRKRLSGVFSEYEEIDQEDAATLAEIMDKISKNLITAKDKIPQTVQYLHSLNDYSEDAVSHGLIKMTGLELLSDAQRMCKEDLSHRILSDLFSHLFGKASQVYRAKLTSALHQ